jgi:hypothetical protein
MDHGDYLLLRNNDLPNLKIVPVEWGEHMSNCSGPAAGCGHAVGLPRRSEIDVLTARACIAAGAGRRKKAGRPIAVATRNDPGRTLQSHRNSTRAQATRCSPSCYHLQPTLQLGNTLFPVFGPFGAPAAASWSGARALSLPLVLRKLSRETAHQLHGLV